MEAGFLGSTLTTSSSQQSWRLSQIPQSIIVWSSSFSFRRAGYLGGCRRRGSRAPGHLMINAVANVNGTKIIGTKLDSPKLSGNKVDASNGSVISYDRNFSSAPASATNEQDLARGKIVPLVAAAILAVSKQQTGMAAPNSDAEILKNKILQVDFSKTGRLVQNDSIYRQAFVIRSYDVGFDRLASIETLTNLFQETALNHVGMSDFVGDDGMGTTHAMMRHRLIWVVTRMHIQVYRYPVWGGVVEIDSWVCGAGKSGMRRDFLVRDYASGEILSRATSTWVMMNKDTRKLSKMPDDVKAEVSQFFYNKYVMEDEPFQKIKKLDDSALYIRPNLVAKLQDVDMNQHVNNVKYIGWVLESVPQSLLVAHELVSMTLEYRRECCASDVVTSMTDPSSQLASTLSEQHTEGKQNMFKQATHTTYCSSSFELQPSGIGTPIVTPTGDLKYTHLLRMQGDGREILRGRTKWRLKQRFRASSNPTQ